ncbi:flagellar basal body L-ring protein FlgH [Ideonella sp. 4Y16]|uniref:Flagellar L-ring protein n=1 Tax=Ideonella alba TaxID=2824118 RepID=A0A940YBF1_9BURK|nr:flagellar basal body L-ring protein FlgH [Ideonella alba]MBQ0933457.1 flagellar basal body L-ring protein FlgH [Ideonella alba]MBQ0944059.1 flagellar basal body L-ring protein FlgH [Ideonella alba]
MSITLTRLLPALTLAALAGCTTIYPTPQVDFAHATAPAAPASGPSAFPELQPLPYTAPVAMGGNGAIYQAAAYRPLFEDYRARMVGDTLTINIVENVSATQTANSTVGKTGKVESSASSLSGLSALGLSRLGISGSSANNFEGKGTTATTNQFSGTITATVVGVLPNGHLLVAGEKQVGVNQRVDVLRFTGQVDPRAIAPGNTVQSAQIANVRIENRGRGAIEDAQGMNWLGRFFLNLLPI